MAYKPWKEKIGNYIDGKKQGLTTIWHENGKRKIKNKL